MGRLWIFSPVYFDVESYLRLRDELTSALDAAGLGGLERRFLIIDDSAGLDPDMARLTRATDSQVIVAPFSLGHQRALVYGLRTASAQMKDDDLVVTLDADGEDQPADLPRLLAPLLADPASSRRVVLAARTRRRESFTFRMMYLCFKMLFVTATGTIIRSGNYAAFRGWFARNMLFHPYFDLCYSSSLVAFNMNLERVPCERGTRYAGQSRMTFLKLIMHGLRMLMPFADRIAIRGLVFFSSVIALTLAFGAWVVGIRLFTDRAIPGWATYSCLLALVLSGVALACILLLFTLFVQSQSLSMSRLDVHLRGSVDGS
ncbi:MAG: glycosyltransferase [Deltaproteobacteria bacterium]|nr:glycosyltransferase [Deltaproteobacteria bacterium]